MSHPDLGIPADAAIVDAIPLCPACRENGDDRPAAYLLPQSVDVGRTVTWTLACAGHAEGWCRDGDDWAARVPGYRLTPLPEVGGPSRCYTPRNTVPDRPVYAVRAECHSDDYTIEVEFDAAAWLEQASNEEITALANCGWGGDYPADAVAEFMEERDVRVATLFRYLEFIQDVPSKKDESGFECHVDKADAEKWLQTHRPRLYRVLCQQE